MLQLKLLYKLTRSLPHSSSLMQLGKLNPVKQLFNLKLYKPKKFTINKKKLNKLFNQ